MLRTLFMVCLISAWGLHPVNLLAQQVTIQQPVVEQFGANTSLSVPDRGSMLIGSVSRGAASSKDFGPLSWHRPIGLEHSRSSMNVSVYIHDFDEMDRMLLNKSYRGQSYQPAQSNYIIKNPIARNSYHTMARKINIYRENMKSEPVETVTSGRNKFSMKVPAASKDYYSIEELKALMKNH